MTDVLAAIQAAYDEEVRTHSTPVAAGDLPLSYEEISDEWLTNTICREVEDARVTAHRLGPADEGNTSRRRILLTYNGAGETAGLPPSIFCKSSSKLSTRVSVGFCGGVAAEVHFYNQVRPLLDIEAPVAVWANVNPTNYNSILMFRDLGPETEFCTLQTDMTDARVREQVALLASFHGRFAQSPDFDSVLGGLTSWPTFFSRVVMLGFEQLCGNGFRAARAVIPDRLFAREADIWAATLAAVDAQNSLPHTLIHADVHLRNWYVSSDGHMGLTDWQCATRGHWARDLAYTIATALPVERRRSLEQSLVSDYLVKLRQSGGPDVAFADAWLRYKQELLPALAWWTVTLTPSADMPDMQPRDSTLEMIRRLTTAIDDLNALDTFA